MKHVVLMLALAWPAASSADTRSFLDVNCMDAIEAAMFLERGEVSDGKSKNTVASTFYLMGYLAGIFQSGISASFELGLLSDESMREYFFIACNAYPEKTIGETGARIFDDLNR